MKENLQGLKISKENHNLFFFKTSNVNFIKFHNFYAAKVPFKMMKNNIKWEKLIK
jgi:hypothetical protein